MYAGRPRHSAKAGSGNSTSAKSARCTVPDWLQGLFNIFDACMGKGASDESAFVETQQTSTDRDVQLEFEKQPELHVVGEGMVQLDLVEKEGSSPSADAPPNTKTAGTAPRKLKSKPGVPREQTVSFCTLTLVIQKYLSCGG